jgi:hypothetical protein
MDKNLIKIEGVYNNLTAGEKFNIFCTMTIDPKKYQVNIKNCEVDQNNNKNLIQFDEQVCILIKDTLAHNTLNIIKNLKNNENNFQGCYDYELKNLAQFLFQFIYNEIYVRGNLTFTNITLIED